MAGRELVESVNDVYGLRGVGARRVDADVLVPERDDLAAGVDVQQRLRLRAGGTSEGDELLRGDLDVDALAARRYRRRHAVLRDVVLEDVGDAQRVDRRRVRHGGRVRR